MYSYTLNLDDVKSWVYPGGEVGIDLPWDSLPKETEKHIIANIRNSDDIMKLIQVSTHLNNSINELTLKYLPYARQDRLQANTPNCSRIFNDIINSLGYNKVNIWDPHSKNSILDLEHANIITHPRTLHDICKAINVDIKNVVIVIPDEGATDRCKFLPGAKTFIQFRKVRDPATGKLSGFELLTDITNLTADTEFLFYDDICDGGGTFLGCLDVLKSKHQYHGIMAHLYTTHGIYSNNALEKLNNEFATVSCANNLQNKTFTNFPIIV